MPRTMNDPHVNALVFGIEHGPALSYSDDAQAIDHDEPGFHVTLKDRTVRFELNEHYATPKKARERVRPYVRNWEMDAGLDGRPGDFRLEFQQAEVIDRSPPLPTPGGTSISATFTAPTPTASRGHRPEPTATHSGGHQHLGDLHGPDADPSSQSVSCEPILSPTTIGPDA